MADSGSLSALDECLNLSSVSGISNEVGKFASETFLGELHDNIVLIVGLIDVGLSALTVDVNAGELHGLHHTESAFVVLAGLDETKLGVNEGSERRAAIEVNEAAACSGISLRDLTLFNKVGESHLEHVVSVVLPDSHEVRLVRDEGLVLMGVNHILLGDQLGDKLASGFPLFLELLTTLWGGSVNAENESVLLISVSE
jgi:hypothetical protein